VARTLIAAAGFLSCRPPKKKLRASGEHAFSGDRTFVQRGWHRSGSFTLFSSFLEDDLQ
jgi:hypothetical protein